MQVLKSKLRSLLFGVATTVGVVGVTPLIVEGSIGAINSHDLSQSMDKIVTIKKNNCPIPSSETLITAQAKKMQDIANNVYADQKPNWSEPVERYKSGLKTIVDIFGLSVLSEQVPDKYKIPDSLNVTNYTTDISSTATNVKVLAEAGVSVCFDEKLDKAGLKSAYTPDLGLITLSPNMSNLETSIHLRRHLDRLKGALAVPYNNLIANLNQHSTDFNRFAEMEPLLNSINKGNVVALKASTDPNLSKFQELKKKSKRSKTYHGAFLK